MQADIIRVDMSMDLESGGVVTIAHLRLPDGSTIEAQIDPTVASVIMAAQSNGDNTLKVEAKPQAPANGHLAPAMFMPQEEEPEPEAAPVNMELVEWNDLPDNELSPLMKQILTNSNVPAEIPRDDLNRLVDEIVETMEAQEPPPPPVGQVQVRERSPRMSQGALRRTVDRDEAGNPLLPGVDTGEVLGNPDDPDEDGVGSI